MRRRGPCVFVSIEAGRSPDAEKKVRALARRVKSDIALRQRRSGMRRTNSVSVFEALGRDGSPKFGAHIVALMPSAPARDKLIESLNRSAYRERVLAKPVDDWPGLTTYLLKEATPQAWYGAKKSFRRIKGSIPLGELGGDRVVLSHDLKETLLRSGRIEPYRRTYAKRLTKVATQPIMQAVEPICRERLFDHVSPPALNLPSLNGWVDHCHAKRRRDPRAGQRIESDKGEALALIRSDLSEALEALRTGGMDNELPHRKGIEVKLAGVLIRIFEYAGAYQLDLDGAVRERLAYKEAA
ncbi:MAG TPA: hypothetical protein VJY34_03430 [Roseiarcus sp.]|nr:hypothetical protein [Roseiarcus sp.]